LLKIYGFLLINKPVMAVGFALRYALGLPQVTDSGKYEIRNPDLCTECSACKRNCPTQAIILNERKGCGCLWNARGQAKSSKKGNIDENSCACGSDTQSNSNNSCCGA